jgi:predicted transposase YbfD/YdcC
VSRLTPEFRLWVVTNLPFLLTCLVAALLCNCDGTEAVAHQSQETLFQVRVDEKTNEIPVAKEVLPTLPVQQRVCTAAALRTHAEFLRLVHELQGATLLTVKSNQPTLYADLATYFADPQARYVQAQTVDRRRGRLQVLAIKVSTEVVYLITTLPPAKASPERLLALNRGHWRIENGSHDVRDVSFGEDRSRLRTGNAPQIMAALRNLTITLIHRFGSSQIQATRRRFASCPQQALALLDFPTGGQQ